MTASGAAVLIPLPTKDKPFMHTQPSHATLSRSLSYIGIASLLPIALAAFPASPPPASTDRPSSVSDSERSKGCGTWKPDRDPVVGPLEVTEGDFLDFKSLPTNWSRIQSDFPCARALSIDGRQRYFREGSLTPLPTTNPEAVARWRAQSWHARALVQAGEGSNRDEVANQNDFRVESDTGFEGATRLWERFANYSPPSPDIDNTLGNIVTFAVDLSAKSRIVLDRRLPDCTSVESACASAMADAKAWVEFDGQWTTQAVGEEFKRVFDDAQRRSVEARVTTHQFCTEGTLTESSSNGGEILLRFPLRVEGSFHFEHSSTWTVPLSNMYDSDYKIAPLQIFLTICKVTPSDQALQSWVRVHSSGRVHASLNAGTWAEAKAEFTVSKLEIEVKAGCVDCNAWNEPSPGPVN